MPDERQKINLPVDQQVFEHLGSLVFIKGARPQEWPCPGQTEMHCFTKRPTTVCSCGALDLRWAEPDGEA